MDCNHPHKCHAARCKRTVQPRLLFCPQHWGMLPAELRELVRKAYRPGQEIDKRPSLIYVLTQQLCVSVVANAEGFSPECRRALLYCEAIMSATDTMEEEEAFKPRSLAECFRIIMAHL